MTIEILRRFAHWTKIKFLLHTAEEPKFYFREREIWWCSLGANVGHEQDGKNQEFERPVLIVKKFNPHMLWILPLTRAQKVDRSKPAFAKYYFALEHKGEDSFAILSQIRTISSRRLVRKSGIVGKDTFEDIRRRMKDMI